MIGMKSLINGHMLSCFQETIKVLQIFSFKHKKYKFLNKDMNEKNVLINSFIHLDCIRYTIIFLNFNISSK